ncbi:MAG: hypothetical protein JWQ90_3757 [Hydrocarboniphaga sp.]|uniref:DUF1800 domain-containing protein n=1 Tax=Hydrocarboniphaga sp. TaxID=2033016 RepID=UPI0026238E53|nr:DUF1800 domain-containing protein [Hydrocarboniphaga sp.]MDB5971307.1 hypothetical protein [Hydrocarboniphaga sp.]
MRVLIVAILVGYWGGAFALSADESSHLALRTGFGPELSNRPQSGSYAEAVDRRVDSAAARHVASTPPPDWVDEPLQFPLTPKDLSPEEKRALHVEWQRRYVELQGWWLQEMLSTPTPLTERMTLFWHGHFATSFKTVKAVQLLYRQNLMLRRYALGNYRDLLHAVARDPAMLLYLNNQQNKKSQPNENFARELLELFTLGEGHYTENDVKEAARAFTGWRIAIPGGQFEANAKQHDDGDKTFLGHRGNLDGDEVIDLILQQPRAAEFIVDELWSEFVSPDPDPSAVQRLAAGFRKNWEIALLLKALLREPAFTEPRNSGLMVKSPVEFVVGTLRSLDLPLSTLNAAVSTSDMGQTLFAPPNVRGWPGGDEWITSEWLLARRRFVQQLAGDAPPPSSKPGVRTRLQRVADMELRRQSADLQRRFGEVAESLPPAEMMRQVLVLPPVIPPVDGAKPPDRLETLLLDPVYNLK